MSAPITQAEWEKLRRESTEALPQIVADLGLPKVLLGYQARTVQLLETTGIRVLFIEKSRRIGETWGLASYAVLRAARAKEAGGMDAMYISYSQEMTREFIDACAMWARAYSLAAMEAQEFLFADQNPGDPTDTRSIQAFRIRFASGFEIVALSSAPRTLRGKQGLVIIDEAAFVDNLKELLKAAMAFLMWGGQVVVCSTHNGTDNEFNVHIQDILAKRSKFAHLRIDFDEALKNGLYERICLVTGEEWSATKEAAWRQEIIEFYGEGADEELFCIPTMGSGAWLTAPLIEARMRLSPEEAPVIRIALPPDFLHRPELERRHMLAPHIEAIGRALDRLDKTKQHAFGYDPARKSDPAIIHLLQVDTDLTRKSALTVEMRNVPFAEQKAIARDILSAAPRLVGAAIDATGMGMNLAEDLGREFGMREEEEGAGLVWAIHLSAPWYNENMPPLKAAFEDGAIWLTRDAEHQADLRLVKIIRGVPSIPPEREGETGKKRHGDFAVSLALAYFASRMQWHEYGYTSVARPASRFQERAETESYRMRDYADERPRDFRMGSMRRTGGIF
ncbi:MAG: terminase family protein [Rhizobiales bacterium]|nr:terminase family protein [Hyphomicrobiales bacterium]